MNELNQKLDLLTPDCPHCETVMNAYERETVEGLMWVQECPECLHWK